MRPRFLPAGKLLFGLAFVAFPLLDQTTTGTITGLVRDSSGALIPGATIQARNVATAVAVRTVSATTGNCVLPSLQVGKRVIGRLQIWTRSNLVLSSNETLRVDAMLDVGALTTPGSAEAYVALLETVFPRIKRTDPGITIHGGGMTPSAIRNGWLERMLKAGGLKFLVVLSIHTYNYSATGRERGPEAWAEWMREVNALVSKYSGGAPVPIVVTEMGWPTQMDRRGTPPDIAAAYLARMYLLARTMPFLKGIWWYDFQDDGWKHSYNEGSFGLLRPDLSPKASYFALSDIAGLVSSATFEERLASEDPSLYVLKFRRADGAGVLAVWSSQGGRRVSGHPALRSGQTRAGYRPEDWIGISPPQLGNQSVG